MKAIFKQKPNKKKKHMFKGNIQKHSAFSAVKPKKKFNNSKTLVKKPIIKPMSHKNIQNIPDFNL
jgi:hypothetical protein|tara:strand:+ start:249 stop:443 length:195 start_codon:yes stop_codon:yes gene_type:complete